MKSGRHCPPKLGATPENPFLGIKRATGPIATGASSFQKNIVVYDATASLRMQRLNGFGVGCHNFQQSPSWPGRACAVLFPVLQGAQVHANQFGKLALAEFTPLTSWSKCCLSLGDVLHKLRQQLDLIRCQVFSIALGESHVVRSPNLQIHPQVQFKFDPDFSLSPMCQAAPLSQQFLTPPASQTDQTPAPPQAENPSHCASPPSGCDTVPWRQSGYQSPCCPSARTADPTAWQSPGSPAR